MKKVLIVLCLMLLTLPVFFCCNKCVFANNMELIHYYPKMGYYYYYCPNFDIENYKKPNEVKPVYSAYTIFVYTNIKSSENFKYYTENELIEDNPGFMFSMIIAGINNKPKYYIKQYLNDDDKPEVEIYAFNGTKQTKYIYNSEINKYVKQLEFDNGSLGLGNIGNPDYVPFHDI